MSKVENITGLKPPAKRIASAYKNKESDSGASKRKRNAPVDNNSNLISRSDSNQNKLMRNTKKTLQELWTTSKPKKQQSFLPLAFSSNNSSEVHK